MPIPRELIETPDSPPSPVADPATRDANEAAEKALSTVTDLIIATLKETSVSQRFAEAQRLCEVTQNLIKARARRAADFKEPEPPYVQPNYRMAVANVVNNGYQVANAAGMMNVNVVAGGGQNFALPVQGPVAAPGQLLFDDQGNLVNERGIVWAGHVDANALMRHMLMQFGPHAQTGAEANRARVAAEEAVELRALQDLLPKATEHWGAILERHLMGNMEIRSNAKPADQEVRAVPPDDPRGHQAGEGDAQADAPPRLGANGVGEQGHGGPQAAGPVDLVGQVAVV